MNTKKESKTFICKICGREINVYGRGSHLKEKHNTTYKDYKKEYEGIEEKPKTKYYCQVCGKELESHKAKTCSEECYNQSLINKHNEQFKNISNIPTCKICGWKANALHSHISQKHKITVEEYKKKYNITDQSEIYHESYLKQQSERVKGDKNPGWKHGGRLSPWSNKSEKHSKEQIKAAKKKALNRSYNTQLDYWLERTNGNVEEAEKLLSERQATCSLENFIKRYGEEEGIKRHSQRNKKWMDNLKSKPIEEQMEINRKKIDFRGYSNESQEIFWQLYEIIKNDFKHIYFATNNNGQKDLSKNREFVVQRADKKFAFFDFFIGDNNKAIEFDGIFWHKENEERDLEREKNILLQHPEISIFHIDEAEYRKNKKKTIQDCLDFIYK